MGSVDVLCSTCAAIDFKSLIYWPEDGSDPKPAITLGTLEAIIQRSSECQLCTVIIDALRDRYKRTPSEHRSDVYFGLKTLPTAEDLLGDEWLNNYLAGTIPDPWKLSDVEAYGIPLTWSNQPIECIMTASFFCSQKNVGTDYAAEGLEESPDDIAEQLDQEEQALRVHRLILTLSPSPWVPLAGSDGVRLHAIWDTPDQGPNGVEDSTQNISPVGSGRKIGPLVETSRVQGWLHQCESEHGEQCFRPAWIRGEETYEPRGLRVIDVIEHRVVELPPQGRYVALSYVWGHDKDGLQSRWKRCLTTSNSSLLKEVNGLDKIDIPQTVQDAMALTRDIQERYLWADALCILQDDVGDLGFQTSQMDLVYSCAVLTILASSGDNSDSGLSGVAGRPRDIVHHSVRVSSDGLCLATTAALSFNQSLAKSTWNKRGWTFQERLLSRRTLVFTPSQIYWLCDSAMWDEESVLELPEPSVWILPQAMWCNDEWDDGYPKFSREALAIYTTQYSTRQLTFPSDVLPAFTGIIRRYEHLNKTKTHWGLPTERFDQALLWHFGTKRREEPFLAVLGGVITHPVPYPSWSWLGWSGFIGANIHNDRLVARTRAHDSTSELLFYSLMSDGTVRPINASDCLSESQQPANVGSSEKVEADPTSTWKGKSMIVEALTGYPDLLASKIGTLSISVKDRSTPTAPSVPVYDTGRLVFWTSHARARAWFKDVADDKLFIDTGDGIVEVESGFGDEEKHAYDPERSDDPEKERKEDDGSTSSNPDGEGAKYTMDFIVISRFFNVNNPAETGKLNIMIVKESDVEPGVWSRIGTTVMEAGDWLRMERSWEMVVLS